MLTAEDWRRHPLRENVLSPAGIPYSVMCGFSPRPGVLHGWGINRDRDFTDAETEAMASFFPFLRRAALDRERTQALEEIGAAVERGAAVLALRNGRVIHASLEALRLLERHHLSLDLLERYAAHLVSHRGPRVIVRSFVGLLRLRVPPGVSASVVVIDEPGDSAERARAAGLTTRQHEVLRALADGSTSLAIGRRLSISPRTVQKHLEEIYRRLGACDRLDAVTRAHKHHLLDDPEIAVTHDLRRHRWPG